MTTTESKALESMAERLSTFAATLGSLPPSIALLPDFCDGETAIEIDDAFGVFPADTVDGRRWVVTEMVVDDLNRNTLPAITYVERGEFPTLLGAVLCALHLWVDGRLEDETQGAAERRALDGPETEASP